jgi:glutamate-1-semialdehyde aminotransferase
VAVTRDTAHVDRRRVGELTARERSRFFQTHTRSLELIERASARMPRGVPMAWMDSLWGHPPVYVDRGDGAHFVDVDGHRYLDMNIADTSMFCGYGPDPVTRAVAERAAAGSQFLLPTEDALWVSEELARRWGLPMWQFTLSATAANTEAIRIARHLTGRADVLMFAGKYHGHADEMLVTTDGERVVPEYLGLLPRVAEHTILVDFNDAAALERALEPATVACVLAEPALTNIGIVQPEDGFHARLRAATRETGTLLVLDETHTLITGPGGLVERWGLEPDVVTLGKSIGGGVAIGAYGMREEVAATLVASSEGGGGGDPLPEVATGGTLFANPLTMAAARAALGEVLVPEAYARAAGLGERLADGIERIAGDAGLTWRAHRLGPRSGYTFAGALPRTAREAHAVADPELVRLLRLFMVNRGVWEAMEWAGPAFSVAATDEDLQTYLGVLTDFVDELTA